MNCLLAPEVMEKVITEVRIYGFEFADALPAGVTVTSVVHTITPAGLTIDSETFSGTETQVTVSGGTADVLYVVRATVTTSNNETMVSDGRVKVCA